MRKKQENHKVRRASKIDQAEDCCGDRYECNIEFRCSCGVKGCRSCMEEHLWNLHAVGDLKGDN